MSVEFIYWYWIYPANYWRIYVSPRTQLSTFSGWTIGPRTVGPWGRNPPTDNIYSPIVGRIYPIPSNWHVFPKCWQLISNMNIKKSMLRNPTPKGRTLTLWCLNKSKSFLIMFYLLLRVSNDCCFFCDISEMKKALRDPLVSKRPDLRCTLLEASTLILFSNHPTNKSTSSF